MMRREVITTAMVVCIASIFAAHSNAGDQQGTHDEYIQSVESIRWSDFRKHPQTDTARMLRTILARASRHLVSALKSQARGAQNGMKEKKIRPPAFNAASLAVILRTGNYSTELAGMPKEEAERLIWDSVVRLSRNHKANGGRWGDQWQSPLWACGTAEAAWLCWESGDKEDKRLVIRMLIHEADRIMARPPPSWNGKGGDSKSEENAWDALIVEIASQMIPRHPHARRWQEQAIRYRLNAVATKDNMESEANINGRMVKEWIGGFNLRKTGAVVNHGVDPHPGYTSVALALSGRSALFYALSGNPVPEANRYNTELIYACLTRHHWDSPPYAKPGGTILSTSGTVYWPDPSGKEKVRAKRHSTWARVGTCAHILETDKIVGVKGLDIARAFFRKTFNQQAESGRTHENAKGEYNPLDQLAHSYLALWLKENDAFRFTNDGIFQKAKK